MQDLSEQKIISEKQDDKSKTASSHSVEFFHIYSDEKINDKHIAGLNYLKAVRETWTFDYDLVVLIDNYNPTEQTLSSKEVIQFLAHENIQPRYWAYEGSLLENADILLENLKNNRLKKSYINYINQHKKYPCSLLTAAWYLTRLGKLDNNNVISSVQNADEYSPAKRLINFLPQDYKPIEERAFELIRKSTFSDEADSIQDLFYPVDSGRKLDYF